MFDKKLMSFAYFSKLVALGIALAAPAVVAINSYIRDFWTNDDYKCQMIEREECEALKIKEKKLRAIMRASTLAEAKVTPEEEQRRRDNFRPHGWGQ